MANSIASETTASTRSSSGMQPLRWCGAFNFGSARDDDGASDLNTSSAGSTALNPFRSYDDRTSYMWPCAFEEADDMLELCALLYPHSLLRQLVLDKKLKDASSVLTAHLTSAEVLERVVEMKKQVEDQLPYTDENIVQSLDRMIEVLKDRKLISEKHLKLRMAEKNIVNPSTFVSFGDETSSPSGLAYAVVVNKHSQRITLWFRGFRGTFFNEDWPRRESYMKEEPNPMKRHSSQRPTMKIQHLVHDSMFCPFRNSGGKVVSQYQDILHEKLIPVVRKYPGYKLYVCGHSSGGALATLFAVEAAAEPDSIVPKPVTCVSIGSPYVGDTSFRGSHQLLEGLGKLRHLRISNHKDTVTIHPNISFRWKFYDKSEGHVGTRFKHVGMNLRLFNKEPYFEFSYPKVRPGIFGNAFDEVARGWDNSILMNCSMNPIEIFSWPHHGLREYNKRLKDNRTMLGDLNVNQFYANPEVVGSLATYY